MGFGPLTKAQLVGAIATQPRQETKAKDGCSTCAGLLSYSSAQVYVEDLLLDQIGTDATVAGVRLSRQKLRSLLELPEANLIQEFDKTLNALKAVESLEYYMGFCEFNPETGRASQNKVKIEEECSKYDLYLNPRFEKLYDRLKTFAQEVNEVKFELESAGRSFDFIIKGFGLYIEAGTYSAKTNSTGPSVVKFNEEWAISALSIPKHQLPA